MVTLESEQAVIFNKGTEVEVTSDEEGFRGAWYRATLVESPPKSAHKKRKKALVEYKYLLADDGSGPLTEYIDPAYIRPLPPEEKIEKLFELNDAVDANYQDGWWTGTVRKVLDDGKLRVCFDSPPDVLDYEEKDLRFHWKWVDGKWVRPEKQFSFLKQSTGSIFSPGATVEVDLGEVENICDVWFPAIIIKENEDGTFFVKCKKQRNGDDAGNLKVTLESKHIRPTPPRHVDRKYELLEKVDTSYGFGWRAGVITKVLDGGRYNVFFKHVNEDKEFIHSELRPHLEWTGGNWITKFKEILIASDNQEQVEHAGTGANNPDVALKFECLGFSKGNSEDKSPNFTNIRNNQMELSAPCHEDATSNSFPPSKKKIKLSKSNGTIMRPHPNKRLTEKKNDSETSSHIKKMPNETEEAQSDLAAEKAESTGTRHVRKPGIADRPPANIEIPYLGKRIKTKQQKFGADFQTMDLVKRKGRLTKIQVILPSAAATVEETSTGVVATAQKLNENASKKKEVELPVILGLKASKGVRGTLARDPGLICKNGSLKLIRDQKKILNDSEGDKSVPRVGGSSQRRKRGRPRKLVVTSPRAPEDDGMDHKRAGVAADEIRVKDYTTNETELHTLSRVESAVSRDFSGERMAQISEIASATKEVDTTITVVSNNLADDDQPLSTWIGGMHSSSEELRFSSGRTAYGLNEAKHVMTPAKNKVLPFVKKSPIWNTIESMEVFRIVPQNPHFYPLGETKEEYREGSAIGIMVTFAGLFDKISMLQFDDSRRIFDSTLESLMDLEKHGFDVTVLRERVNALLSIRIAQEQNLDSIKDIDKKIVELSSDNMKLDTELEETKKKISELQVKLDSTKLKKEMQVIELSRLQSHLDGTSERVKRAQHDFEKLATAPWKSP